MGPETERLRAVPAWRAGGLSEKHCTSIGQLIETAEGAAKTEPPYTDLMETMKISKIQVGQVFYSTHRHKMGNTTISTTGVYAIKVTEVDPEGRWVKASSNYNRPQKFSQSAVSRWKATKPVLTTYTFGHARLATKVEIAMAAALTAGTAYLPEGNRCLTHDIPFEDARVGNVETKACWKCREAK